MGTRRVADDDEERTKSIKGNTQSIVQHSKGVCVRVTPMQQSRHRVGYGRQTGARPCPCCTTWMRESACMPKWRQINQKTRLKTDKSDCAALSYAQFNLSDNFCSWQQSPQSRSRSLSLALCLYPCLPSTHCSSLLLLLLLLTRSLAQLS